MELLELDQSPYASHESLSPFCLKVHRALKAAQLPYARVHKARPSDHRTPTGQVPALRLADRTIYDSTLIVRYVAAQSHVFAEHPEAWLWEEFADTALNGFLVASRWADPRNWPLVRHAYFGAVPMPLRLLVANKVRRHVLRNLDGRDVTRAGLDAWLARLEILLDSLEARAPEQGFWLGALTVADIAIFAQLHSLRTPLTQPQWNALNQRRKLSRYLDRLQ